MVTHVCTVCVCGNALRNLTCCLQQQHRTDQQRRIERTSVGGLSATLNKVNVVAVFCVFLCYFQHSDGAAGQTDDSQEHHVMGNTSQSCCREAAPLCTVTLLWLLWSFALKMPPQTLPAHLASVVTVWNNKCTLLTDLWSSPWLVPGVPGSGRNNILNAQKLAVTMKIMLYLCLQHWPQGGEWSNSSIKGPSNWY